MAQEEIKLVGVFRDEITPKLKKLNKEINTVTRSFGKMRQKLQPIARDFEKIGVAVDRVGQGLSRQNAELKVATTTMSKYRTQVRRTAAEQKKLKPMRGGGVGGGGGRAPRGVAGGGGGFGGIGAGFATAGVTIGNQFGAMVMQGMRQAFDMYKGLLLKPFQFLASGIQERIDDEMDDIKTAGGLFSISKRSENPFIDNFQQAESLTKETNRYLAELAGALPGDTQQYISVSRQISDGIYQILSNDKEGSLNLAKKIADQNGRTLNYEGMSQGKQIQMAGKELVGEMTKLTVLGSMGQRQGAMGLPQLIEQMMSQDQVSSGQFRRYAAIFRDPLVKGALERNIPKINQAGKNTADRLEALKSTLDEVVTPELVRRYQRSTAGVIEEMKTIFLNPEVGMLGLGKPLKQASKSFNQFGEELYTLTEEVTIGGKVLEKGAQVTARQLEGTAYALDKVATASFDNIAIFDYVRDIFGNLAIVMSPIIQAAAGMFTGFDGLGSALDSIRNFTMKLQNNFEQYRVGLEALGKNFGETVGLRAALGTINNLFANLGVISDADFMANALNLKDANFSAFPEMITKMFTTFLSSTAAIDFGAKIGELFGTILTSFTEMITGAADPSKVENIFSGFVKGFKGKDGVKSAKKLLRALVSAIGKGLLLAVKTFPFETFLVSLAAIAPALISGLVAALPSLLSMLLPVVGKALTTMFVKLIIALASGAGAAIAAGLAAVLGVGVLASIFYEPIMGFINGVSSSLKEALPEYTHTLIEGITNLFKGVVNAFAGIGDVVIGIVTLDGPKIVEGVMKLFGGIIQTLTGAVQAVLGFGEAIRGAITALFNGIITAITTPGSAAYQFGEMIVTAVKNLFTNIVDAVVKAGEAIKNFASPTPNEGAAGTGRNKARHEASSSYDGNTSRTMSLGSAIATESKNKPAGSHLVIANSSETVIPAFKGYVPAAAQVAAMPAFTGYAPEPMAAVPAFTGYAPAPEAMAAPAFTGYSPSPESKEVNIGGITVNVTGNENATEIAEQVAQEIVYAIQKSTYNELYTT